jgi:hypothetical protein
MTSAANGASRPRTLTDAVKARQARRNGGAAVGDNSQVRGAGREDSGRSTATDNSGMRQRRGRRDDSWLSRLLAPLKQLGQNLLEALDELASDPAGGVRKLGALAVAGVLAKRLPGPLGWLAGLVSSYLKGERGFGFWWQVVTLGVALAVGALVALLVSPVAGLIALLVVGVWMLVRKARDKNDDKGRSEDSPRESNNGREPAPASSPA